MQEVILGAGAATGMFYHAPAGTKLPDSPFATLDKAWVRVGDITEDGIHLKMDRSTEDLKNWAKQTKRTIMTDHGESIEAPIMDTTEESLKTVFGKNNVTITAASASHGALISVNISANSLPDPEAYLFLMKDGDTGIMIGCEYGQIDSVSDVSFAPGSAINWTTTFKGLKDGWKIIFDDGAKTGA